MAILSQRKAIEGFILSQGNQKYIEKMGRFAYSLQEVLSYFILSPRCLYDGSKVAYGGREGASHPPRMELSWPPDGSSWRQVGPSWRSIGLKILPYGDLFCLMDRIFAPRSLKLPYLKPKMPL